LAKERISPSQWDGSSKIARPKQESEKVSRASGSIRTYARMGVSSVSRPWIIPIYQLAAGCSLAFNNRLMNSELINL